MYSLQIIRNFLFEKSERRSQAEDCGILYILALTVAKKINAICFYPKKQISVLLPGFPCFFKKMT